jgi:hypothetical protein
MDFNPSQIRAFRYWIQGYQNFYEPIVLEYFKTMGYRVVRRPAKVDKPDIQRVIDDLFDGQKRLGPQLDSRVVIAALKKRARLQPDVLLERDSQYYLAELKSWGGFNASGQFDLSVLNSEFIHNPDRAAFFFVDFLESHSIAGKILVVSARSPQHERVLSLLQNAYQTPVKLLYLDEIFRTPQLAGFIERQLRYLDAAVAEINQAFRQQET